MEPEIKKPRKYNLSAQALRQRKEAGKRKRTPQGRTVYRAVNVPEMMLPAFDAVKDGNEPYWQTITRSIKALAAIKSMRDKLSSQGDPEIKKLVKFLEAQGDGGGE